MLLSGSWKLEAGLNILSNQLNFQSNERINLENTVNISINSNKIITKIKLVY